MRAALWSPVICVSLSPPPPPPPEKERDRAKREMLTESETRQRSAANAAQPGVIEWSRSALFVRHDAAMYEDWYTSAPLSLPDRQTDWYYTPAEDKDKVSVIMLNTRACQRREIIQRHWLWEHFADCHENLSGRRGALWHSAADGWGPVKISAKDWITTWFSGLHLFHYYHVCPRRHCKSPAFLSGCHLLSFK